MSNEPHQVTHQVNGSIERWIIRGLMGLLCFVCMFVWNQVQTHDREIMELRVLRERDAGERAVLRTTISRLDMEVDRLRGQAVKSGTPAP